MDDSSTLLILGL